MGYYDFRGVGAVVNIYAVDTGKTGSFTVMKHKDAATHLPYFHALTIKETISGFNEVSVQLQPPEYGLALELLESEWLTIGNTLSVKWGYTSDPRHWSPWFHTIMMKPDIGFSDEFSVTLKGVGFGWQMGRVTSGFQWSRKDGGTPARTREQIIQEIVVKKHNFKLLWNHKPSLPQGQFAPEVLDLLLEVDNVNQGYLNDFVFVKKIAAECGCRAFITKGDTFNIVDARLAKKDVDFTLVYRGQIDLGNNVFPIDSFDSDSTPLFIPRTGIASKFLNPDSPRAKKQKKLEANEANVRSATYNAKYETTANPQSPTVKGPDGKTLPAMKKPDEKGVNSYLPVPPRQSQVASRFKNIWALKGADASSHGISAKCSGPAIPAILPEAMVTVKGVGKYFSVPYRVYEVLTTVGNDFAKMDLDLKPKGFPGGIARWLRVSAPKVQKYDPGRPIQAKKRNMPTLTDRMPFDPVGDDPY